MPLTKKKKGLWSTTTVPVHLPGGIHSARLWLAKK